MKRRKLKCSCGKCQLCRIREYRRRLPADKKRDYAQAYREEHRAQTLALRIRREQAHYDFIRAIELRMYGPSMPSSSLDPRNLPPES